MVLSWATFQPAQVPKQNNCGHKRVPASIAKGCERAETGFFSVELAEKVHTLYGKCSVSAAGNGKFRPETEDAGANGRTLVLQASS